MPDLTVNASRGAYTLLPASSIRPGDRARKEFSHIAELAASITKFGLDNPVTVGVADSDGKHLLIAGERRFRAMLALGITDIPCVTRGDLSPALQKEFELEENLQRSDLTWDERIEGERQLDEIMRQKHGGDWRAEDTAEKIGGSRTTVSREIQFARKLKRRPDLAAQVKHLPLHAAIKRVERIEEAEKVSKQVVGRDLQAVMERGDSRTLLTGIDSESIALVLTDPPFGIQQLVENAKTGGANAQQAGLADADNLDANSVQELFEWFLPELERVLKPGGHFYIFCCQQLWWPLRTSVLISGLELQEYPLIWWKRQTTAPGRGYLYMPCTEPIMFGWKPPRRRILERNMPALLECKPIRGKKSIHPFQKPVELLKTLISQSTLMGETVLDPFCGSASTLVAAVRLGRAAIGFDLDESNSVFPLARRRVEKAEAEMRMLKAPGVNSQLGLGAPEPPPPLASSYDSLVPSSPEWRVYWDAYPNQRKAMLVYAQEYRKLHPDLPIVPQATKGTE